MSEFFDKRQKGFEAKFKIDQENEFKIDARRNKLLGLWLAEKLGVPDSDKNNYAQEIILSDLEEPGVEDIIKKALGDINAAGANVSEADIRIKLTEFREVAISEIESE